MKFLLMLVGTITAYAANDPVILKDSNLQTAVLQYVPDRQADAPLTAERAATLILIRSTDKVIRDLSGLE